MLLSLDCICSCTKAQFGERWRCTWSGTSPCCQLSTTSWHSVHTVDSPRPVYLKPDRASARLDTEAVDGHVANDATRTSWLNILTNSTSPNKLWQRTLPGGTFHANKCILVCTPSALTYTLSVFHIRQSASTSTSTSMSNWLWNMYLRMEKQCHTANDLAFPSTSPSFYLINRNTVTRAQLATT